MHGLAEAAQQIGKVALGWDSVLHRHLRVRMIVASRCQRQRSPKGEEPRSCSSDIANFCSRAPAPNHFQEHAAINLQSMQGTRKKWPLGKWW